MQLSLLFTSHETFNSPGSYSSLWDLLFSSGVFQTEIYFFNILAYIIVYAMLIDEGKFVRNVLKETWAN